jgi:hypothetical protein
METKINEKEIKGNTFLTYPFTAKIMIFGVEIFFWCGVVRFAPIL